MTSFSSSLAQRTRASHSESEGAGFMSDLLRGKGTADDYVALSAQHWFIYRALEDAVAGGASDPVLATLHDDALLRVPAIEADLAHLIGANWRREIVALPVTEAYVARIGEVADWTGGVVAHHYTRYLGDLSGGQYIAKAMRRAYGIEDGLSFYDFAGLGDLKEFKDGYRAALDAAPWDEAERERIVDEVLRAYDYNTALFDELAASDAA